MRLINSGLYALDVELCPATASLPVVGADAAVCDGLYARVSSGSSDASAYVRTASTASGGVHLVLFGSESRTVLAVAVAASLDLGACYTAVAFQDGSAFSIRVATDAAAPPRPAPGGGSSVNGGLIGGVVGGLMGLVLIAGAVAVVRRRRARQVGLAEPDAYHSLAVK